MLKLFSYKGDKIKDNITLDINEQYKHNISSIN